MLRRGVYLLHDNAPAHTSNIAQAAIHECGFNKVPHPPYSPDLAPSDYHLFPNLKQHLRGRRFRSDAEAIDEVEHWFSTQTSDFYISGINALQKRLTKCIELNGDYVEKKLNNIFCMTFLHFSGQNFLNHPRIYIYNIYSISILNHLCIVYFVCSPKITINFLNNYY